MKLILAMVLLLSSALIGASAVFCPAEQGQTNFPMYDSMAYKRKPDTAKDDLIKSNILYEAQIWPERQGWGTLPNREVFEALVRANSTNPGPLVIDIEHISIGGSPRSPHNNVQMLAQLADWAHEAVPGKVIG